MKTKLAGGVFKREPIAVDFKEELKDLGRKGYGLELGVRGLFLQFYYDHSDRQIRDKLRYDIVSKWFCNLKIDDATPDHSYFSRMRKRLGTEGVAKILQKINRQARKKGEESLNNANIENYSADKDARFGCKGKNKFWFGYKKHISVDMGSGLINKIAITPANITDQAGLKHICPEGGMVFADKQYCCKRAQITMKSNGCHSGAILKNNMMNKNKDKDRWITKMRAPFEMIFSKMSKRARYRGLVKVQLQAFLEAIVFNVKRLIVLDSPPLFAAA